MFVEPTIPTIATIPSASVMQAHGVQLLAGEHTLVTSLDWDVQPGQFWCVLGRNGAGKSTLLHAVAGLQAPSAGTFTLQGHALARWSPLQLAQRRGLLLQHQYDAFSLPVLAAVMAGRFAHGGAWRDQQEDRHHARQALQQVGLAHLAEADLTRLSGGERQRVALATLLAQSPRLYLLDEPTSHQDIAAQLRIMQLLRALAQDEVEHGGAVVASCHDVNLVLHHATHVLLLGPRQHYAGPVEQIMQPALLGQVFGCRFKLVGHGEGGQGMLVPLLA